MLQASPRWGCFQGQVSTGETGSGVFLQMLCSPSSPFECSTPRNSAAKMDFVLISIALLKFFISEQRTVMENCKDGLSCWRVFCKSRRIWKSHWGGGKYSALKGTNGEIKSLAGYIFLLSSEGKLYSNSHLPPEAFDEIAIFELNDCVKRCPANSILLYHICFICEHRPRTFFTFHFFCEGW